MRISKRMSFWLSILVMYWVVGGLGWISVTGLPALIVGVIVARKFHKQNCAKIEAREGLTS